MLCFVVSYSVRFGSFFLRSFSDATFYNIEKKKHCRKKKKVLEEENY